MVSRQRGMAAIWAVLITVIIMLGLAGGGYYYLSSKHGKDKAALEKSITELKSTLEALKKAAASSAATKSSSATSATSSTSSSLKTYTNQTYGYQFQYPIAFSLIDYLYDGQSGQKIEYGKIVVVDKKAIAENALKSESEISNPYLMVTAQSDHQFGLSELSSGLAEMGGELSDTTVDGVDAWKVHYTEPNIMDESYSTSIYVNHGIYGLTISWKNSNAAGTHDAEIDAIVASFKWL